MSRPPIDITGQVFGGLTAVRSMGKAKPTVGHLWLCNCVCGKQCTAPISELRRGRHISCGCKLPTLQKKLDNNINEVLTNIEEGLWQ